MTRAVIASRPEPDGPGTSSTSPVWRLSDPAVFAALARSRTRLRVGPLTVSWVAGNPTEPPRVAYAISKRVGGAVVRNRLRRRLRAIVATSASTPGAYLVSASPAAAALPFPELKSLVSEALQGVASRAEGRR